VAMGILIVDDHPVTREGLRSALALSDEVVVLGEASSGEEAVEQVVKLEPDVVFMDVRMPGIGGIEATRRITEAFPDTVVFLCSTYTLDDLPAGAVTSGAAAYVNKAELGPAVLRRLWDARGTTDGGLATV
jgi:two-component system invasion response regulator UvrY